ncbi:ABC transporter ATP-binding protein/permease [Methylobacterium sp. J-090]|uniref:ABC transporter ATP-binding protein/permease n=1 Tax=Methylobacterium sp. J-090 TaxID=2836666 RepID=UPI001FB8A8B1|nr:ATP-binding cassette domain-containing protein [Methylobacterium sp. J-090]MCJ2080519.1 ATP-binding cassette domain-containing protein [Methylobacterium sp. J-090]
MSGTGEEAARFDPSVSSSAGRADLGLDRLLLRRIGRFFVPFWTRRAAWPYWIGMAAILGQTTLATTLNLAASYVLKDMTNALTGRDWTLFRWQFLLYAAIFLGEILVAGLAMIVAAWITRGWRIWLTAWITGRYLDGRVYYDIAQSSDIDNPDQRIQESLATVVTLFFGLPVQVFGSVGALVAGSAVLATIDGRLALVVIVVGLAQAIATYLGYVPLVRLRYAAAMATGNLRYALAHVHGNAEAIAFYGGEPAERTRLHGLVGAAVRRDLIVTLFRRAVTDMAPLLFGLAWVAIPYLVLAPRLLAGEIDFGTLMQGTAVSATVSATAAALLGILAPLSGVAPHAVRIAQIVERFDGLEAQQGAGAGQGIARERRRDTVVLDGLSLETPGGEQCLVRNLSLTLEPGENLVIVGRTGVGKSSVLRAMAGLWTRGEGRVVMPPAADCLFLPQRPYVTRADLRTQLLYPHGGEVPDAVLLDALTAVRLADLAAIHGGLSTVKDWGQILSLGEQQRLAFARVLIARPRFVLLDEATSAVDAATEAHLYSVLVETGARFVSVGHRVGILDHHTQMLTLEPGGGWILTRLRSAGRHPDIPA